MNNLPLTFREQAAIAAMSALISIYGASEYKPSELAAIATGHAEALEEAMKQHYCNCCMTERSTFSEEGEMRCNICGSSNLRQLTNFAEEVSKIAKSRSAKEIDEAAKALQALII